MEAAQAPLFPSTRTEHKKSVGLRGLERKIQHATSLVNAYPSRKDLPEMNLGVLKDMPGIRQKACEKLAQPQKQVYLTTWLADANVNMNRIKEVFATVEDDMQVKFS